VQDQAALDVGDQDRPAVATDGLRTVAPSSQPAARIARQRRPQVRPLQLGQADVKAFMYNCGGRGGYVVGGEAAVHRINDGGSGGTKKKKKKKKEFFFHTSFFFRTTKKTYMTRNKPATRPGVGATKVCRSLGEEEEGLRRTSRNTSSS